MGGEQGEDVELLRCPRGLSRRPGKAAEPETGSDWDLGHLPQTSQVLAVPSDLLRPAATQKMT